MLAACRQRVRYGDGGAPFPDVGWNKGGEPRFALLQDVVALGRAESLDEIAFDGAAERLLDMGLQFGHAVERGVHADHYGAQGFQLRMAESDGVSQLVHGVCQSQ